MTSYRASSRLQLAEMVTAAIRSGASHAAIVFLPTDEFRADRVRSTRSSQYVFDFGEKGHKAPEVGVVHLGASGPTAFLTVWAAVWASLEWHPPEQSVTGQSVLTPSTERVSFAIPLFPGRIRRRSVDVLKPRRRLVLDDPSQ